MLLFFSTGISSFIQAQFEHQWYRYLAGHTSQWVGSLDSFCSAPPFIDSVRPMTGFFSTKMLKDDEGVTKKPLVCENNCDYHGTGGCT